MRAALVVVTVMLLHPVAARAQDAAQAEDLFKQGRAAMKEGRIAEACALFEQSLRFDKAPVTELNLARCYEQLGRVASAWGIYVGVGDTVEDDELRKIAAEGARALEPRLPRLEVRPADAGARIEVDGKPWAVGVATAIDPGEHQVVVSADGKEPWRGHAVAVEGKTEVVAVPALAPAAAQVANTPDSPDGPVDVITRPAPPPRPLARWALGARVGFGQSSFGDTPDPVRDVQGVHIGGPALQLGVELDLRLGRRGFLRAGVELSTRSVRFERCAPCTPAGDVNQYQALGSLLIGLSLLPGGDFEPVLYVGVAAGVAIGDWEILPPATSSSGDYGPSPVVELPGGLLLRFRAGPGHVFVDARVTASVTSVPPEPVSYPFMVIGGLAGYSFEL